MTLQRIGGFMRKFSLFIIVGSLFLTACGTQSSAEWLDDFRKQEVSWGTCDKELFEERDYQDEYFDAGDVKCAEVRVPLSYDPDVSTEEITIQLMLDPAKQGDSEGYLLSNPGGPGQSGISYIQFVAYPKSIRDAYDIVGFDPRGVGFSTPVKCDDDLDLRSYYESHFDYENQRQADEDAQFMKNFYEDCMERNPHWWGMTTENTVRDIDVIREVLSGDAPLNFIGHSYGTTLAARYISMYPEHVGRIILDSPVTANTEGLEEEIQSAKSVRDARNRLFDKCAADTRCPGDTRAEVENYFIEARDSMLSGEMDGHIPTLLPQGFFERGNGTSPYLLMRGLLDLTYYPLSDAYPFFKQIFRDLVLKADPWGFEYLGLSLDGYTYPEMTRDNSYDILNLVNCLDRDERDTRTKAEKKEDEKALEGIDTFEERFYEVYDFEAKPEDEPGCFWTWRAFESDNIPNPPKNEPRIKNASGTSVLIFGSRGDNVTPYAWSQKVARDLKSNLVTYEGTGHAVLFSGIDCLDDLAVNYMLTGTLPPKPVSCSQ